MKALALFLALCASAGAQTCTTLAYIGAPQSTLVRAEGPGNDYFFNAPLIGTVTLSAPLAPNLANAIVVPIAWDFSTAQVGLNSASAYVSGVPGSFSFSTDANGNIVGWTFSLDYGDTVRTAGVSAQNPGYVITGVVEGYAPGTYFDDVGRTNFSDPVLVSYLDTTSTAPGAWHCLAPLADPLTAQVSYLQNEVARVRWAYNYWINMAGALMAELRARK